MRTTWVVAFDGLRGAREHATLSRVAITVASGPWDSDWVMAWLTDTVIPIRLATSGARGPIVQSLWFLVDGSDIWCATQSDSTAAHRIRRDGRVGWEVSADQPPYRGVRGRGAADVVEDVDRAQNVLQRLIVRYGQSGSPLERWLLGRVSNEVAIRITALEVTSWDYSRRM